MSEISQHILQQVARFIAAHELLPVIADDGTALPAAARCCVGLSGGPDSVALLHILHTLGYHCTALHCNFHLRGDESDRDEQFCRMLCTRLGVPLLLRQFDTHAYMATHHLSLEMAARELRYQWWHDVLEAQGDGMRIAIGHHQDDSIETLLMNLMRGTGINGMTGIVAHNERSRVVRPLLCLSRADILQYLADNDLTYVTDSTNSDNDTLRNQIRNELLPLMQQLVPQVRHGIIQTMQHLADSAAFASLYLQQHADLTVRREAYGLVWHELDTERARQVFGPRLDTYLHEWERQYCDAATQRVVTDGRLIYTCPRDTALFDRHRPQLSVEEVDEAPSHVTCSAVTDTGVVTRSAVTDAGGVTRSEVFDADTVRLPLTLRRWQDGDRMAPLGMHGHTKLLSDIFTNAHYTPMQKRTTWLVCDATGTILWLIGLRMSDVCKVTPQTTRHLRVKVMATQT